MGTAVFNTMRRNLTVRGPRDGSGNRTTQARLDTDLTRIGSDYTDLGRVDINQSIRNSNPLDHYTKEGPSGGLIGEGTFGKVYRVKCKRSKVAWAMKEINLAMTMRCGGGTESVQAEMAILLTVDHPYLMRIKEGFRWNGSMFQIIPLVEGGKNPDLMTWILGEEGQHCTPRDAATMTHHVAAAIKHLNDELNAVHRDLKPENVLIGPDGLNSLLVTDYGLSRQIPPSESGAQGNYTLGRGTPNYRAYEMLFKQGSGGSYGRGEYGFKVDVFSLGVMLFLCVTKSYYPFVSDEEIRQRMEPDWTGARAARVGFPARPPNYREWPQVVELLEGMLAHNPEERFSMGQVLAHPFLALNGWPLDGASGEGR